MHGDCFACKFQVLGCEINCASFLSHTTFFYYYYFYSSPIANLAFQSYLHNYSPSSLSLFFSF